MLKMTETNNPKLKNTQIVTLQDKKKNETKSLSHRIIVCLLKGDGKFWHLFNVSIITQVIIEILVLSLAENGVIFRYKTRE